MIVLVLIVGDGAYRFTVNVMNRVFILHVRAVIYNVFRLYSRVGSGRNFVIWLLVYRQ